MDNIINLDFHKPKTVSPVSMKEPRVGNVAEPNFLNRITNYGISPSNVKPRLSPINTTLSPSPRNNVDNDPACVNCKNFIEPPFQRNKCYMLYSPQQNIWGQVCGDGGSNANWVRGNRFGDSYEYSKIFNRDPMDINVPKFIKKNPTIISDSPFYKFPDYDIRYNKEYKSYPYVNNFIDGKPTYVAPYIVENFENDVRKSQNIDMLIGAVVILGVIYYTTS